MELDKPKIDPVKREQNLRLEVLEVERIGFQRLDILARDIKSKQESTNGTNDKQHDTKKVLLEGVWTQNHIYKNSFIHLINPQYDAELKTYTVNNSVGFAVIEPDSLLTCTLVASSLFCERKTWLNSVFLGQVGTNRAMLVGTLVHEVFQYGVKNKIADIGKLTKYLDELLDDATVMLEIYSVELHINDVRNEAISYISSVKEWIEKYMFSGPRFPLYNEPELEIKVIGVTDIEENVWSTKYGLKGKIDVTGAVRIYNKRNKSVSDKTIPLELKTGNPNLSSSHAAQVSLYSMMIEDRYSETNQGFVIYLKNKAAMHNVSLTHNIKRDLIQRRNQINFHMKNYYFGPNMIDQSRMCKNCDRLTECILMSNIYQPGRLDQFSEMKSLEPEAIGHLEEKFAPFFQKYHEKLSLLMSNAGATSLLKEATGDVSSKPKGSFWTYTSEEAEIKGTGFGKLQALECKGKNDSSYIMFKRHPKHIETTTTTPVSSQKNGTETGSQPSVKRMKIHDFFKPASRPNDNGCDLIEKSIAKPFDTKFNFARCRLAISLDDDGQNMDSQNSSTAIAIGFMNDLKEDHFVMKVYEGAIDLMKPDLMYRVDKLEKRSPIDIERMVLVRLLAREDWRCDRVRQLLLDPKFGPKDNTKLNLFILSTCFEEVSDLDDAKHQKFVVEAAATDNYYVLDESVEPDKEKVKKIVSVLAQVILTLSRTLLIVAQNVDHLVGLMKILQTKKIKFILIDDGKSSKARYQFASNLIKVIQSDKFDLVKKFDVYIKQHETAPVVITTYAMSIGGLLFTRRTFDYCVAYDCDSTELLVSLSPMFCSDRLILIDIQKEKKPTAEKDNSKEDDDDDIEVVYDGNVVNKCDEPKDVTLGEHLRSIRRLEKS